MLKVTLVSISLLVASSFHHGAFAAGTCGCAAKPPSGKSHFDKVKDGCHRTEDNDCISKLNPNTKCIVTFWDDKIGGTKTDVEGTCQTVY